MSEICEYNDMKFPMKHKKCGGLIHLKKDVFMDGYSCDIELEFICDICKKKFYTWTEGENIEDEFREVFGS